MQKIDSYMLWMTRYTSLSGAKILALIKQLGSAEDVFNADKSALESSPFITNAEIKNLTDPSGKDDLDAYIEKLKHDGIEYVSFENPSFPEMLLNIPDMPVGLYYKGRLPKNDEAISIAVIGSRECTGYGQNVSYRLSRELAERGVSIVSGLARGIDGMAHRGALDAKGYTVAVLGTGIDECYPKENIQLYNEICEKGCVLTEFYPTYKYNKSNFPRRNRIISGLSQGLIVVEAAIKSGTSITVDQALEQGREIFAVPGNIYSEVCVGTNALIKDGAVMVTCCDDVLNEFSGVFREKLILSRENNEIASCLDDNDDIHSSKTAKKSDVSIGNTAKISEELFDFSIFEPEVKEIYDAIGQYETSIDLIAKNTGKAVKTVLYSITLLEIHSLIKALPGGEYCKTERQVSRRENGAKSE